MKLFGRDLFFNEHEVLHKGNYKVPNANEIIFEDNQSLQLKYDMGIIGSTEGNQIISNLVTRDEYDKTVNLLNDKITELKGFIQDLNNYYEYKTATIMEESCRVDINILSTLSNSNRPITSVTINNPNITLSVNQTTTIQYNVAPRFASNKGIVWISSDITVAKVDSFGNVTAEGPGEAIIFAIATDGRNSKLLDTSETELSSRNKNPIQELLEDGLADKVYAKANVTVTE